jgi:glycosyltransferase involved in cell wall biosynthesis
MRIGIDIRCLVDGKRTGVEEYTINVLEQLFERDKSNEYVLFLNSYHESGFDPDTFSQRKNVSVKRFRYPNKILNLFFWYLGWPHVDKMIGGVDVFFMPNINFIGLSRETKLVLTVHDLSFEIMPEAFSLRRRLWHGFINTRKLCQRADRIIAVSESTKADIESIYKISREKITRIYNGAPEDMAQLGRNDPKLIEVKKKYHLPFNFIFYLGTVEPRKNIPSIVAAFDEMKSQNNKELDKFKLVIAGGKGWGIEKIFKVMRQAKYTDDIIYTSCIINEDKAAVLTLSSLFVYPSFFEGFGIPVLEAMKCGVPVITSNVSALPEVVGDSAIMVDPYNPDELLRSMKELLLNRELAQRLSERGKNHAFRFTWKASARELLGVFEELQ